MYQGQTELYIMIVLFSLLLYGGLQEKHYGTKALTWGLTLLTSLSLGFASLIKQELWHIVMYWPGHTIWNGLWKLTGWTTGVQLILLISGMITIWLYLNKPWEGIILYQFVILSSIGLIMVSDLIGLYLVIELLSFALYLLAAIDRESPLSGEGGLKYFLLGALSSAFMLLGIAFIYGLTGQTSYTALEWTIETGSTAELGTVAILASLLFKLGAAPFHMWLPDVYHGARTAITGWFAIIPKLSVLTAIVNLFFLPNWIKIMVVSSVGSLIIGGLGALNQGVLKRLFAYSAIGHVGFLLIALPALDTSALLFYTITYQLMSLFIFTFLSGKIAYLGDLGLISRTHPIVTALFGVILLSLAGIPPTLGFLAKYTLFIGGVRAGYIGLVTLAVVLSVISAFYYIRVIQIMYFNATSGTEVKEVKESIETTHWDTRESYLLAISGLSIIVFFWYPTPLIYLLGEIIQT